MHTLLIVFTDKPTDLNVKRIMEPFYENDGANPDGKWDWYQIGGRWTGLFDNYEADKDPVNSEPCWLCGATGKRIDMVVENGCNACHGTGTAVKHPSEWVRHDEDIQKAGEIKTWPEYIGKSPYIDSQGGWHDEGVLEYAQANPGLFAVVVDFHD
jgi:hypothetical protein